MSEPQLTSREYAYVHISGPGTHETITQALGFQPSEAWNIGDINPSNGRARRGMLWVFRSGLDDTHPIEQHIQSLLFSFNMKSEQLKSLWVEYDITLQCVGYYPPSRGPGIHFNREVVRQAAQLGMSIDCDLYFVHDEDHVG